MTVYLDKEDLGPEVLPRTENVEDDLHDVGVLTRFPVLSKLMNLESSNASQRGRTADQKYDGLCDIRLSAPIGDEMLPSRALRYAPSVPTTGMLRVRY